MRREWLCGIAHLRIYRNWKDFKGEVATRRVQIGSCTEYRIDTDEADKYTTFTPHGRNYRQSVHKVPKWTKVSAFSVHPVHSIHQARRSS
jgi:hypothetical protein